MNVEEHGGNFKFSNNTKSVTACNDSLRTSTLNVNFVCATCGKCALNDNHDACVLYYINKVNSRTKKPLVVPISTSKPKRIVNRSIANLIAKQLHQTALSGIIEVEYTCTHFIRSKEETPGVLIDFLIMIQRGLQAQNGVVKRRNRTLVEAARTMLSAANLPLFFWAEAIATTCFTQNRSLIIPRHEQTPYHIINKRKPNLNILHVIGCKCYIVRDGENLGKMKEKGDAGIFVGYSTQSKG
ncbi:retrovirus-related pol polyprotein from transposon TNT 1-94 [Tanacetum coccineum]